MISPVRAFLLVAVVSGCATQPSLPPDAVRNAYISYIRCMDAAAVKYAPSNTSTIEVAEIAHSACGVQYQWYADTVETAFVEKVSRSGEVMARLKAREHAANGAQKVKQRVMRVVTDERMKN